MATDYKHKKQAPVMSSPLSLLKKMRRTPLQCEESTTRGQRENLSTESQVLNDQNPSVATTTRPNDAEFVKFKASKKERPSEDFVVRKRFPTPVLPRENSSAASGDFELMSSMVQRLTSLERTLTSQKEEMTRKDNVISVLREQLKAKEDAASGHVESCGHLERRCKQLQHQVDDMESFLNDYGLIWVGDKKPSNAAQQKHTSITGTSVVRNFRMDFDLVIQMIKELNVVAGESFVRSTSTGAQLARNDPVELKLYSNGIVMFNGPFRSYQENSTQQCMQDLMEGYFPSELQGRFPNGVPFEVHDRREEEFVLRAPWDKFPGKGQAVREKKEESPSKAGSQFPGKTVKTNQFLNRLPKVTVKAGQVVDIRDAVRPTWQGSSDTYNSCSAVFVNTPALRATDDSMHTITSDQASSARNIVTLKVKSEDGDRTYLLKMSISETVGHLRQHLDTHRGRNLAGYDIISASPQCHYHDDRQTLGSCGLATNTTILLRGRKNTNKASV
ncbi:UBX domain-containing protein 11 [Syngnathoides biaculeatus]|uniref:UBX domain-containing protein 11 n=1 Tax=Syngnathoides biaculeatus TaxID=300417 RepID=UPI002ADDFA43|nr:UBX domain-containing protein 11 [Syngnathoides biaculeatus]